MHSWRLQERSRINRIGKCPKSRHLHERYSTICVALMHMEPDRMLKVIYSALEISIVVSLHFVTFV